MTVAELLEALDRMPPEAEVYFSNAEIVEPVESVAVEVKKMEESVVVYLRPWVTVPPVDQAVIPNWPLR